MKKTTFMAVYWRSFFLQALWNFERLQNVGFAFAMLPIFRLLYPEPAQRRDALLRHLSFFNTHPYMVNIVFGMVASMEEDMRDGRQVSPGQIDVLKNNMAGPLAAIGDTFFWGTWRPFTILLSIGLTLFFYRSSNFFGTWLAPLTFLLVYNAVHIAFRYWSLRISYQLRTKIVEYIADLEFQYAVADRSAPVWRARRCRMESGASTQSTSAISPPTSIGPSTIRRRAEGLGWFFAPTCSPRPSTVSPTVVQSRR
jgi:PTS system mannose-specific IID component